MPTLQIDRRTLLSFLWFFSLLFGWYCARPVRETLASIVPESQLKWVMSATFVVMLIVTPIYGGLARVVSRRYLFLGMYALFVAAFVTFALLLPTVLLASGSPPVKAADPARSGQAEWLIGLFYVWASFFSLFSVSCFWSFVTEIFSTDEAKKQFGRIAAGGTAGSILASLPATLYAKQMGIDRLLATTAVSLLVGGILAQLLDWSEPRTSPVPPARKTPRVRDFFTAFRSLLTSPYLLAIALYLFVGTAIDIVLYFNVNGLMKKVPNLDERTQLFSTFNLVSNLAIVFSQLFVTPWCLRNLGTTFVLVSVPLVYALSFGLLGFSNTLFLAFAVGILIRVLWLSLIAPAREVLFTSVSRDDKYATKNLIDTVFVRGGGVVPGFVIDPVRSGLGSMERLLWATIPFALLTAYMGSYLGRTSAATPPSPGPSPETGSRANKS